MDWKRLAPLTGVVFAVLIVVSFIVSGNTPNADASTQEVVSFYTSNDASQAVSGALGGIAAVFFLFFLGTLRGELRRFEDGPGGLSATVFAGGIILAVGGATFSAFSIALADTADDISPIGTQAINALSNDFFIPFAVGTLVFLVAAGIATIRDGAFPRWIGWAAIVIGVLNFTPLFVVAGPAALLWVAIVSIMLSQRAGTATATPAVPPPAAPPPPA